MHLRETIDFFKFKRRFFETDADANLWNEKGGEIKWEESFAAQKVAFQTEKVGLFRWNSPGLQMK